MRRLVLALCVLLPGLAAAGVSGFFLLRDWSALTAAFLRLEEVVRSGGDTRAVLAAQGYDQIYRLNCFADGVGVLLGLLIAAVGIHGLCTLRDVPRK
jgi:hypothetical protein